MEEDSVIPDAEGIDPQDPRFRGMLEQLQGNILRSHGRDHVRLVFLRGTQAGTPALKKLLGSLCREFLTSAFEQEKEQKEFDEWRKAGSHGQGPDKLFANVFLTKFAYDALGDGVPGPDDPGFLRDRKDTRDCLNDSTNAELEANFKDPVHAMVLVAHHDERRTDEAAGKLIALLDGHATHFIERGRVLRDPVDGSSQEPFGFADGKSQPLFFKTDLEKLAKSEKDASAMTVYNPGAKLRLALVRDIANEDPNAFGSYLVYRKLKQDVAGFQRQVRELAATLNLKSEDLASALVVGRFKDGTPLMVRPRRGKNGVDSNNFDYIKDPLGDKCPLHAHIRRANPRSSIGRQQSRRIVRRGVPYENAAREQLKDVGLHFMCFQASIAEQFEAIQKDANNPILGIDPIIGQAKQGHQLKPQQWPIHWKLSDAVDNKMPFAFRRVVTLRGSEYFFAPSIGFLKSL